MLTSPLRDEWPQSAATGATSVFSLACIHTGLPEPWQDGRRGREPHVQLLGAAQVHVSLRRDAGTPRAPPDRRVVVIGGGVATAAGLRQGLPPASRGQEADRRVPAEGRKGSAQVRAWTRMSSSRSN